MLKGSVLLFKGGQLPPHTAHKAKNSLAVEFDHQQHMKMSSLIIITHFVIFKLIIITSFKFSFFVPIHDHQILQQ